MRDVLAIAPPRPARGPVEKRPQADQKHARFRDEIRLPDLAEPVALRQAARGASSTSDGCASGSSSRGCASGRSSSRSCARSARSSTSAATDGTGEWGEAAHADGIHQVLLSGLLSHIGLLASGTPRSAAPGGDRCGLGARDARLRDLPRQRAVAEAPAVRDGRRARRDQPAVRPGERRDDGAGPSELGADLKRTYSEPPVEEGGPGAPASG